MSDIGYVITNKKTLFTIIVQDIDCNVFKSYLEPSDRQLRFISNEFNLNYDLLTEFAKNRGRRGQIIIIDPHEFPTEISGLQNDNQSLS